MRSTLIILMLILSMAVLSKGASIDIIQKGVSGSISSDIEQKNLTGSGDDSHIFFGTQIGAYVFAHNGTLLNFIQTGSFVTNIVSIPDINNNNYYELVFTTTNTYFPNVLCYDSYSGEKLWEFSSETEVFDMDMLWTMKQVSSYGLTVPSTGDKIYLTAGYNVFCLDSQTGNKIASFEGTDNMWDIILVDGDVVVGDQNGYLYRLDGESLSLVWEVLISQSYTVVNPSTKETMGTVTRSVWDITSAIVDSDIIIAACCEDGYFYTINFNSGKKIKSVEIIDYVNELLYAYYGDYPLPTSYVDYNFFNIRVESIPDVTGDGDEDFLVYTYPGRRGGNEYQGAQKGIYIVDSSKCSIVSKNENFDLEKINKLETITSQNLDNNTYILLPTGKSGSAEKVKLVSSETCETYKTISINSTTGSSSGNLYYTKVISDDKFLLCSNSGDLLKVNLSGNISWNYPRLNNIIVDRIDLVGSPDLDFLVCSDESNDKEDSLKVSSSRTIYVVDGETKTITWYYEMPYDEYLLTGGLIGVTAIDDLNNDGKKDIFAYKQRKAEYGSGDEYGEYTRIIVFSGNGTILYEKPLREDTYYGAYNDPAYRASFDEWEMENIENNYRIRKTIGSLDVISDVSGDDIPDFFIGSWKDAYILNSTNGEIVWTKNYDKWDVINNERMNYFSLGDHNSDGYDELLMVSWDEMYILRSKYIGGTLDFSLYKTITYDGNVEKDKIKIVEDQNGDGHSDIVFLVHITDSPSVYKIISGLDGTEIMELEREGTTLDLGVADFDGDNYDDSIVFYMYGSSGPRLEVRSGRTAEVIWNYLEYDETWMLHDTYGISTIMPACYVDDINGDGYNDLAIGRALPRDTGADVLVYDVKNNILLKTINVESIDQSNNPGDRRWQPAIITAPLSDLNNDGIGEVAVVMALGGGGQKQLKLVILDIAEEEIICDFVAKGTEIKDFGELIATYGSGGELYLLNPEKDISITSPNENQRTSSPIRITWDEENKETVKTIVVDSNIIMKTTGEYAEFELKEGNRKITIFSFDKYGKGLYTSVDVTVDKSSATATPLTVLVIIFMIILFIPKLLPRVLSKKPKMKKQEKIKTEEEKK